MNAKLYECKVTNPKHFAVAVVGATAPPGESTLTLNDASIKALKISSHGIDVKKGKEARDDAEAVETPEAPAADEE